jgi:hypothetical protein
MTVITVMGRKNHPKPRRPRRPKGPHAPRPVRTKVIRPCKCDPWVAFTFRMHPIDYDAAPGRPDSFQADHYRPRSTHPHLALVYSNLRPSCARCNWSRRADPPPVSEWKRPEW